MLTRASRWASWHFPTLRKAYSTTPTQISPKRTRTNANRDLILSILNLTTTRRETNQYLQKYSHSLLNTDSSAIPAYPKRLLLLKIRGNLAQYPQDRLKQLQTTLSYLIKLGNSPVIVLDSSELIQQNSTGLNFRKVDNYLSDQLNLLSTALQGELKVLPVRSSLSFHDNLVSLDHSAAMSILQGDDNVPVVLPYVFDVKSSINLLCESGEFMHYLIKGLLQLNLCDQEMASIEKVIFIDDLGGIPSIERSNDAHVFINLNQEHDLIASELQIGHLDPGTRQIHSKNLNDMELLLSESGATGIITTLDIATETLTLNPIIYNVLTDRSLVSSSLPPHKISSNEMHHRITKTTVLKKGLAVHSFTSMDQLDLVKFKRLIDDSFKRSLNLEHYLARISNNINRIIIVGDYDGCAIVTNEYSPSTGLTFPYLDKFAISREAQGSLGVADMIFNLLLKSVSRDNFLVWRSKKVNPVNGWYFQRSSGSFDLPNSEFRLFWNGKNPWNETQFKAFKEISSSIEPSFDR